MTAQLELIDVHTYFPLSRGRTLKAVNGVTLSVAQGETFGLVGESGCGKSTLGRTIKGIYAPTTGSVHFDGQDITRLSRRQAKAFARRMQMIFQDPYASLNPRMTVGEIIGEGLEIHGMGNGAERADRIREIMALVGLSPDYRSRFPHEFSGGQRQRIAIARALVLDPALVVCDEPISALDVSIQGQIVNLLKSMQQRMGLTYIFVAHNLSMVKYISDRVGVMYLGRLVEVAPKAELFGNPLHPYTRALLSSVRSDPRRGRLASSRRRRASCRAPSAPSPVALRGRCPLAHDACRTMKPVMVEPVTGHTVMCTLYGTPSE